MALPRTSQGTSNFCHFMGKTALRKWNGRYTEHFVSTRHKAQLVNMENLRRLDPMSIKRSSSIPIDAETWQESVSK